MVYSAKKRLVTFTFGNPHASWFLRVCGEDAEKLWWRYTADGELDRRWKREGALYSLTLPMGHTYSINTVEDKDRNLGTDFSLRIDEDGRCSLVFPGGEADRWNGECQRWVIKDKKVVESLRRRLVGVNHMSREEIAALAAELAESERELAGDTVPIDSEVLVLLLPLPADVMQLGILPFLYISRP